MLELTKTEEYEDKSRTSFERYKDYSMSVNDFRAGF